MNACPQDGGSSVQVRMSSIDQGLLSNSAARVSMYVCISAFPVIMYILTITQKTKRAVGCRCNGSFAKLVTRAVQPKHGAVSCEEVKTQSQNSQPSQPTHMETVSKYSELSNLPIRRAPAGGSSTSCIPLCSLGTRPARGVGAG